MLDTGKAVLCRAEWLPALEGFLPLSAAPEWLCQQGSALTGRKNQTCHTAVLGEERTEAFSETSFPSHGFSPLQHGAPGLSVITLLVNIRQAPEVQVFQYTWDSLLPVQT